MRAALLVSLLASTAWAGPYGPAGWARGDIHLHTVHSSDGRWPVAELWQRIVDSLPVGPRFAFVSDHSEIAGFWPNPTRPPVHDQWGSWEETRALRARMAPGDYLGTGQEIGGLRGGHVGPVCLPQAAGQAPPRIVDAGPGGYREWMERIHAAGGLNVVYHPRGVDELGPIHPGSFGEWADCLPLLDGLDVWNGYKLCDGPDQWAWDRIWSYWLAGRRITAVAGSDAHQPAPDGVPLDWWGRKGRMSFQCHPLNPHLRVRTGPAVTEDGLRDALRQGRVTLADWPENWIDLRVGGAGIGETATLGAPGAAQVEVVGYGAARVYSGEPRLVLEYGRVGDAARASEELALPRGDFAVAVPLPLRAGEWLVTARVLPQGRIDGLLRGVQIANPVRVRVAGGRP